MESESSPARSPRPKKISRAVALLPILFGLAGFYFLFVQPIRLSKAAQNWKPVSATVLSTSIRTHTERNSSGSRHGKRIKTSYTPHVTYRYSLADKLYTNDRFAFLQTRYSNRYEAENILKDFPEGKMIPVYVNPENPTQAVIFRTLGKQTYTGLLPLLFVVIGLFFLFRSESPESKEES
jgi:hypothetical protein